MASFFCLARAQQPSLPIGELFAADGGAQPAQPVAAGLSVLSGSELSAGVAPARLRLVRGGQMRICPHSSVTVNSAPLGLMFSMDTGAVEIDYTLPQRGTDADRAADSLITPDFGVLLAGTGRYHFALAANRQGDTCVKTLPGNSAPIQISELLSSSSYELSPQESVRFHDGRLKGSTALIPNEACGCPEPLPVQQAAAEPPTGAGEQLRPQVQPAPPQPPPVAENSQLSPPEKPAPEVHTRVEAPFVFSAKKAPGPEPYSLARLTFSSLANLYFVQETVDPVVLPTVVSVRNDAPPRVVPAPGKEPLQKKEKKGFFSKLKGLFWRRLGS